MSILKMHLSKKIIGTFSALQIFKNSVKKCRHESCSMKNVFPLPWWEGMKGRGRKHCGGERPDGRCQKPQKNFYGYRAAIVEAY
jgi:hypothetical protein